MKKKRQKAEEEHEQRIEEINKKMLEKAKDRDGMSKVWDDTISVNSRTVLQSRIPKELKVPVFTFNNIIGFVMAASFQSGMINGLAQMFRNISNLKVNKIYRVAPKS